LRVISLGVIELGIGQAVDQVAIIGEQQQTFAVIVQATGRVNVGQVDVVAERRATVGISEGREDAVGFVEDQSVSHALKRNRDNWAWQV
jgi:hypothetical protein